MNDWKLFSPIWREITNRQGEVPFALVPWGPEAHRLGFQTPGLLALCKSVTISMLYCIQQLLFCWARVSLCSPSLPQTKTPSCLSLPRPGTTGMLYHAWLYDIEEHFLTILEIESRAPSVLGKELCHLSHTSSYIGTFKSFSHLVYPVPTFLFPRFLSLACLPHLLCLAPG